MFKNVAQIIFRFGALRRPITSWVEDHVSYGGDVFVQIPQVPSSVVLHNLMEQCSNMNKHIVAMNNLLRYRCTEVFFNELKKDDSKEALLMRDLSQQCTEMAQQAQEMKTVVESFQKKCPQLR